MVDYLKAIPATPFLWDASERNVLVHNGKITGIVDVDELCFGDPSFVIALTSTALELEEQDTVYTRSTLDPSLRGRFRQKQFSL
jgi:aminoglycoside phosphotransferase (APT) family kinase protein